MSIGFPHGRRSAKEIVSTRSRDPTVAELWAILSIAHDSVASLLRRLPLDLPFDAVFAIGKAAGGLSKARDLVERSLPAHRLVNGTLTRDEYGVLAKCVCGWASHGHFNPLTADAAFQDHVRRST